MPESELTKRQLRLITEVNRQSDSLARMTDQELVRVVESMRAATHAKSGDLASGILQTLAITKEAIRRTLGWQAYDVQLLAAHALMRGEIAEMQTGEGKTIAGVPVAVLGAIQGKGVHVAAPNSYLSRRDFEQLKPIYESLGFSVGLLDDKASDSEAKRRAYECDITYGPGFEFGFDYLRDQIILKELENAPLGTKILNDLVPGPAASPLANKRGLFFSIIDEADNVLIDDASSPLVLSEYQPGVAPDSDAILLARDLTSKLRRDEHYRQAGPLQIELTKSGKSYIYGNEIAVPVEQLTRPWTTYVETALRAAYHFQADVHYVVTEGRVKIVDATTGRIFDDRSWQAGLHQAIEAKENLVITPEKLPLAQITRQRFYRLYDNLSGMTGTATNCKSEFKSVYNLGVTTIPLRLPSKRLMLPMRVFDSADRKWDAITDSIIQTHQLQRPVLIGTATISESEIIAERLRAVNLQFQLLNGKQDAEEAEIISLAGQRGAITIATNLAGRGTDIKLGPGVEQRGGLHVIVCQCHESARNDRQLVGRCARQGNAGSAQTFVSADDWLLQAHGEWLAKSIKKIAVHGEVQIDIERRIRKIQQSIERASFENRMMIMRNSNYQSSIFQAKN